MKIKPDKVLWLAWVLTYLVAICILLYAAAPVITENKIYFRKPEAFIIMALILAFWYWRWRQIKK